MVLENKINEIAEEVKKEVDIEIDLSIGNIEHPAQAAPILCERMDKVCGLMDYQAELISIAEKNLEEAKYQYKHKELLSKKLYNESFCKYKQEDRLKPREQRRTDPEYQAMAELEANISLNEALTAERDYLASQHYLDDAQHKYEILNNHFLSYRKACDLLVKEMNKLGGPRERYTGNL